MAFQKATKKKAKLRAALIGPSGSGKTYTALKIARGLGTRIALIDTERGSASLYAGDVADFDVCELRRFGPREYIAAMKDAADAGYDVLVVDSLSHAWSGEGGILDQKDAKGGRFDAWRELTPQHNALVEAILSWPGHVVVTMRVKTEYVVEHETRNGKTVAVPRKVGLAPVQRDGLEYEFTFVGDLDEGHALHISKSRCHLLPTGDVVRNPGEEIAQTLLRWLDSGEDAPPPTLPVVAEMMSVDQRSAIASLAKERGIKPISAYKLVLEREPTAEEPPTYDEAERVIAWLRTEEAAE